MWGDPHITTLDGAQYTFNGYGEYTMMKIDTDKKFTLQARTELFTDENGVTSNATVFSAFAARDEGNNSFQAELSETKKSMYDYYVTYRKR